MFFLDNGYTCICFDKGRFDEYCVYVRKINHSEYIPKDIDYFYWIYSLAKRYGKLQVWNDFCKVYDIVDRGESDDEVLSLIVDIDMKYSEETILWWLIFYMTMLAECKKENTILKKRIKKLGVYNVLFDEYAIEYTVEYMKGVPWQELNELMIDRGI